MVAVQGYFKNKVFINEHNISILDGQPVIITVLDKKPADIHAEAYRQKVIFNEFFKAIHADDEVLGEAFDAAMADRPRFRDVDFL